jgi:hypothetical protein
LVSSYWLNNFTGFAQLTFEKQQGGLSAIFQMGRVLICETQEEEMNLTRNFLKLSANSKTLGKKKWRRTC